MQENGSWSMGIFLCSEALYSGSAEPEQTPLSGSLDKLVVQEGLRSLCGRTREHNLTHESSKPTGFTMFSKGCAHWRGQSQQWQQQACTPLGGWFTARHTANAACVHCLPHDKPKDKGLTSGCLLIVLVTYSGFSLEAQGHGLFLSPSQKSNLLFKNLFRTHNYN